MSINTGVTMTSSTHDRPKCVVCQHKFGVRVTIDNRHLFKPVDVHEMPNRESYWVPFHPFCGADCALEYARSAFGWMQKLVANQNKVA